MDIVNTFQRATNLIINREFRCDNLAKLEPIFSDDIDATITSVTFIRNAIIIRKLPEDFIVHTSYRNHNMACDPEGEAEREAVEAADAEAAAAAEAEDEAAEAAKQAEAEAEADDAETQR